VSYQAVQQPGVVTTPATDAVIVGLGMVLVMAVA
jgi:hypothetical protein